MAGDVRIGISGWTYDGWRGTFYPKGLPHREELHYASRQLNSIEINGTFYSLQKPSSYQLWHDETPDDFVFAVKGPRFITHMKRLRDVEAPLANFFASGLFHLKAKLGPILWQLPPRFLFREDVIERFLKLLPHDLKSAAKLSRRCDDHLREKPFHEIDKNRPLRHAMEVRHQSFVDDKFIKLLRAYGVALVFASGKPEWPSMEDITADFIYARLHGDKKIYVSGYGPKALDHWAKKIKAWRKGGRDVYIYFDNDVKVRAPYDAISLVKRIPGVTGRAN